MNAAETNYKKDTRQSRNKYVLVPKKMEEDEIKTVQYDDEEFAIRKSHRIKVA